ncbi:MAG: NADH-quinone oxidoreductase subunit J [Candidatus Aramenus sp.]|nr:NADH-quinone oxidoreductase subunit J [Candidatus Aramenus sp.]
MSLTSDFQLGIFAFFSVVAMASAIFIVRARNVFYSAIALAFLGVSVAILIADISPEAYSIYSAFHLLLYVGATVVFLSISLVMFKGIDVKEGRIPWSGLLSVIATAVIFIVILVTVGNLPSISPKTVDLQSLAVEILQGYWFPAIILVIGLLTTVIEAISLARRE